MPGRVVLHSDMNNCYASIECMLDPSLRGHPIAVCGNTEERHGIVLAKNQLAKKFGVKTGDVIWEAKQKCPNLIITPPHMDQYIKYSKIVREIYLRYSPEVESFGLDECWIELTGNPRLKSETGESIANEIRETVKAETGLTVSVGVSFNKIFAKLGSDMRKPDAVTVIPQDGFHEQIWPLPASDLLYVGRATTAKLDRYGIRTIGQLAGCSQEFLQSLLGKNGLMLWRFANGLDTSRVMPSTYEPVIKSIGHGITCTADLVSVDEVRHIFMELSQEIGLKLRQQKLMAQRVQISVRDNTLSFREYQAKLPFATQSYIEICTAGVELFQRRYGWSHDIRSLTIRAIDLVPADSPIQLDLWMDMNSHQRKLQIEETIETIRRRFGQQAINFASLVGNIKYPGQKEVEYKMPSVMYQ